MTQLERQQRGLLDLIKNRGLPPDDAYLQRVAGSPELAIVREIAIWWRAFQIEDQCHFTARLLKHRGSFDTVIASYFNQNRTSPYIEELCQDFLNSLRSHDDPLIRAVAEFEYAFLRVRAGSPESFEICWDRHPELVFLALENGSELPPDKQGCLYRMQIARDLPRMMVCTQEAEPGDWSLS